MRARLFEHGCRKPSRLGVLALRANILAPARSACPIQHYLEPQSFEDKLLVNFDLDLARVTETHYITGKAAINFPWSGSTT